MYSYIKDNGGGGKTAKGINKNVIKKDIKHKDYKNTLFNCEQIIEDEKNQKRRAWNQ